MTAVRNISSVNRALLGAGVDFRAERDQQLRQLAVPVQRAAEQLASSRISGLRSVGVSRPWAQQRIGVLSDSVYIAPVKRGTRVRKLKRRNFAGLLLGTAMKPALEQNRSRVGQAFDRMVANMVRRFNGAG